MGGSSGPVAWRAGLAYLMLQYGGSGLGKREGDDEGWGSKANKAAGAKMSFVSISAVHLFSSHIDGKYEQTSLITTLLRSPALDEEKRAVSISYQNIIMLLPSLPAGVNQNNYRPPCAQLSPYEHRYRN